MMKKMRMMMRMATILTMMLAAIGDEEEGVLLDCESISISSSSTSTGKRASNAAKLLGR